MNTTKGVSRKGSAREEPPSEASLCNEGDAGSSPAPVSLFEQGGMVARTAYQKKKRKWEVTTRQIAEATGRCTRSVRNDIAAGRLKPWDLTSLSKYVTAYVSLRSSESGFTGSGPAATPPAAGANATTPLKRPQAPKPKPRKHSKQSRPEPVVTEAVPHTGVRKIKGVYL